MIPRVFLRLCFVIAFAFAIAATPACFKARTQSVASRLIERAVSEA